MGQINLPDNWIDEKRDLQRQIDELRAAVGLSSATISRGGLKITNGAFFEMQDASGNTVVYIGPDPGGGPSQVFQLWRPGGHSILVTQLDVTSGRYFTAIRDWLGHIIVSDDVQTGGMARPYLPVPLYPLFSMAASSFWQYMNIPASAVASETLLWEGRIPLVSHPRISVDGVWGTASGTNTPTYKLYVNGVAVGTWTAGLATALLQGPYDISSLLDSTNVVVQVKASATGTGNIAVQVLGCYLRQT